MLLKFLDFYSYLTKIRAINEKQIEKENIDFF